MGYCSTCSSCVMNRNLCDGYVDEHGHCDFKTTERDLRTSHNVINFIGQCAVAFGIFVCLWCSIDAISQKCHERDCTGHKTGHCGWAWCKYYDGSDSLHDFNF